MVRFQAFVLLATSLCMAAVARAEPAESAYTDFFYASGNLRIQAYLYRPSGDGPFPVVIYNHGSRVGRERESVPFPHIGEMLTRAGYVALVPERRGYGKSDGQTWQAEVGNDQSRLIPRLQSEADDVIALLDHLRGVPFADVRRAGIIGWSFGGIVTMIAASRSKAFKVAVNQAGGALTWDRNPYVRSGLSAAAAGMETPTLLMVAKNDRTTASITTLAEIFVSRGVPHRMILYEPYTPARGGIPSAPGHALFAAQGLSVWERDVVEFLDRYLKAGKP